MKATIVGMEWPGMLSEYIQKNGKKLK